MPSKNLMGLDVGSVRVGVAIATDGISIARPLTTLQRTGQNFWSELSQLVRDNDIQTLIIGLPRGLEGQDTAQTKATRDFANELTTHIDLPMVWQDEALTSVKAEETLRSSQKPYNKSNVDALAASYILADYIQEDTNGTTEGQ